MSKNVKLNGNDYLGVSTIQIPTTDGIFASFKDVDEIVSGADTTIEDGLITRTLTEYSNDRVTTIGGGAFEDNKTIEKVSFPNVTSFGGAYTFSGCTNLKEINFPKLEQAGGNSFTNCPSLVSVVLPRVSGGVSVMSCTSLSYLDCGRDVANNINVSMPDCDGATSLTTIVLRYPVVALLQHVNFLRKTPFAEGGTGGTVYVPSALIESYQTANNWSTLYAAGSCNFAAIEGSEYE